MVTIIYFCTTSIQAFMEIQRPTPEDIPEIADLFRLATDAMLAAGIDQWNYTYPLSSHILQDLDSQSIFIYEDNDRILATITLDGCQDEQYRKIKWVYPGSKPLVIHRLAVHPDAQGMGLATKMCMFAEDYATRHDFNSIRLDAYSRNPVSLNLYRKLGYKKAGGYCYFHKNPVPFFCFEKMVKLPETIQG